MEFKEFLITESKQYLADKINDVLTSIHEVLQGGRQIGARQLIRSSEDVVNQIRRILHTSWSRSLYKHLRNLQKCGVGIMKAIDEKGDLEDVLNSCRSEIEDILEKLGKPINNIGSPEQEKEQQPDEMPQFPQPNEMPVPQGQQPPEINQVP